MHIRTLPIINMFLFCISLQATSQIVRNKPWNLLESSITKILIDEKGKRVGCNGVLECMAYDLEFYSANYHPGRRQFSIEGTVRISGTKSEWLKLGDFHIYLAKPVRNPPAYLREDTLTNMRQIGITIRDKSKDAVFPNRLGDFSLKFVAEPNDKLYFFAPGYGLVEYNIDRVVSGEITL